MTGVLENGNRKTNRGGPRQGGRGDQRDAAASPGTPRAADNPRNWVRQGRILPGTFGVAVVLLTLIPDFWPPKCRE